MAYEVVMSYHLHMPSYFLGTFTEYPYLVDLSKGFEWLFNIKISDCHQKHEDVIKRKPGKLTEFLNGLANLIKNEHDKKGYR